MTDISHSTRFGVIALSDIIVTPKPEKGLKFNPNHDPHTGEFSSGDGDNSVGKFPVDDPESEIDKLDQSLRKRTKLTPQEVTAVGYYTASGSVINQELQAHPDCIKTLDCIHGEIGKSIVPILQKRASQPLPEPVTVYRGAAVHDDMLSSLKKRGTVISMTGFVSTSIDPTVAARFGPVRKPGESHIVMKIYAKTGVYVENYSTISGEKEVIQAHGTRYRVTGWHPSTFTTDLEEV